MTTLDLETNAEYTRQRVAEIRAMSRDHHASPIVRSRRYTLAPLRVKLGAGLIAAGERLARGSVSHHSTPAATRLSSS